MSLIYQIMKNWSILLYTVPNKSLLSLKQYPFKFPSDYLMNELYCLQTMNFKTNRSVIRLRKLSKFATDRDEPLLHESKPNSTETSSLAQTSFIKRVKSEFKRHHVFLTESEG
jgi:hypothetical protein